MSKVPLRRLLSKLTAIALSTSAVGPAAASGGARRDPAVVDDDTMDDCDRELDGELGIDVEQLDPRDAAAALGRSLALALDELRPLEATHLASTWAISADPVRRLALAHALEWAFPLVGDALVLDHLTRDTDPEIRLAATRAAQVRRLPLAPVA